MQAEQGNFLDPALKIEMNRAEFVAGVGTTLLLLALGCTPRVPYADTKINPQVFAEHINNDPDLSPAKLALANKYRGDFFRVLREFTPNSYLLRGAYTREDGTGFWAIKAMISYITEDRLHVIDHAVTMGPDGQPYTISNYYDDTHTLRRSVLHPGTVPGY